MRIPEIPTPRSDVTTEGTCNRDSEDNDAGAREVRWAWRARVVGSSGAQDELAGRSRVTNSSPLESRPSTALIKLITLILPVHIAHWAVRGPYEKE
ncbi:hypothetical protein J6590_067639 [Homalodisca vitripennis]|nr:hypothetical protein J6590_067639 [Homalodisca vitripennis]